MSLVRRLSKACLAWLWFATTVSLGGSADAIAGAPAPARPAPATFDSYTEGDGRGFFALKLTPQIAQPAEMPHDVVVLFDTSASQMGAYRDKAFEALRGMLAALSADDRVSLLAVDVQTVKLTASFTAPTGAAMNQALAALERRVPLGSTDMPAALDGALATWSDGRDSARVRSVVYIGDGFSIASLVPLDTLRRIVERYKNGRVSFSSYGIGPRVNAELLGSMANHTGGMVVPDMEKSTGRQVGSYLASIARGAVIWPTETVYPAAIKLAFPRQMPPLRFDRDSVVLGTFDPQALAGTDALDIEVRAELAGKPVTLSFKPPAGKPIAENAYLGKIVEWAALTDGVTLPTAGSASLEDMRRWIAFGAQQLARLGQRALAVGRVDEAAKLAGEAERLDPDNAEADVVRSAAARSQQPAAPSTDLHMVGPRVNHPAMASANEPPADGALADGALVDDIEHQNRVVQGFLWAEVHKALNQANEQMNVDPDSTGDLLKLLLEKVQGTAEVTPEARAQMVDHIESSLRAASRMSVVKTETALREQQANAASDARDRINRSLLIEEQKVDQLMSRFNALMIEERFRDAESLADIAEEVRPSTPGLRNAELAARTTGHTVDVLAARDMRHKGTTDTLYQVELSYMPAPDDPPIIYPDPGVWQLLSERRKKFNSVDLTDPKPSEAKILSALEEPTEIDFSEQPLSDVMDYLRQRHGIEIQLDNKALTDAGAGSEVPITRTLSGISLRSALKLILGEIDCTYVLRNEVLLITSKTEAESMLSTRVYPLADLVVPITPPRNMMGPAAGGMGGGFLGGGMPGMMGGSGMRGMGGMGGMGMGMGGMGMGMGGMGMGMPMGGGMGFF